jgi:cysteine-rich repeat protein
VTLTNPNPGALDPMPQLCVPPDQEKACDGVADGVTCNPPLTGTCYGGVCMGPPVCGNGWIDPGEVCDDNNNTSGDGCSADCKSNETCGNGITDSYIDMGQKPGEQCDDGGPKDRVGHDGCAPACTLETPAWTDVTPRAQPPIQNFAAAYDTLRQRIVVFGGNLVSATGEQAGDIVVLGDTWESDGSTWIKQTVVAAPTARSGSAITYDEALRRVVLFGGTNGDNFADTWLWDGNRWMQATTATAPPARNGAAMTYDARRKVVVMFGGYAQDYIGDTWEFDGKDWKQVMISGPSPRSYAAMAYDPKRAVVVLAGGNSMAVTAETWEYDGASWTQTPAVTPDAINTSMAFDGAAGKMVAFGGDSTSVGTFLYDGTSWTTIADTTPGARFGALMVADTALRRVAMMSGSLTNCFRGTCFTTNYVDTWLWDGAAWAPAPAPQFPAARSGAVAAYDPFRRTTVMVSGTGTTTYNEAWELDPAGAWHMFPGPWTNPTFSPSIAFDMARREAVVFGGRDTVVTADLAATWLWKDQVWVPAATPPGLAGRIGAAMGYDVGRARVVMYGGTNITTGTLDETWEWDGTTWTQRTPVHTPGGLASGTMAYDPVRGVLVLFGGQSAQAVSEAQWLWDGVDWVQDPVTFPEHRAYATLAWDAARRSLISFGGSTQQSVVDETWERGKMGWALLPTVTSPGARTGHVLFPDPSGAGVMTFGGGDANLWRMRFEGPSDYEICTGPVDEDHDGAQLCKDSDCWTVCHPQTPPGAAALAGEATCGDGTCDSFETCHSCPADCATCATVWCGDNFCDAPETSVTCPGDCP